MSSNALELMSMSIQLTSRTQGTDVHFVCILSFGCATALLSIIMNNAAKPGLGQHDHIPPVNSFIKMAF